MNECGGEEAKIVSKCMLKCIGILTQNIIGFYQCVPRIH